MLSWKVIDSTTKITVFFRICSASGRENTSR